MKMKNLPKGWEIKKLKDIGKIISGGTPSTTNSEYWNGNIPWISPSDLTGYKEIRIKKGKKFITEEGLKKSSARLMPKGSVLFSCRAPIGYVVIADDELCTNQGFKSVIPEKNIDSLFLYYFLKRSKQEAEKVASGTTFKEISLKNFSELNFPLPPLETQQRIVTKIEELFSELDKGVEELKKTQEQLKTYRQSVLKWAFEGRFTNENVKDGVLPEGWEWKNFDDIIEISKNKYNPNETNRLFYIGLEHIEKNTGNLTVKENYENIKTLKNQFSRGELLYGKLRPNLNKVYLSKEDGVCSTDILVLKSKGNCRLQFLKYLMLGSKFVNDMSENTNGVNLPRVSTKYILEYKIQLPPIEEQHQIVQEIESRLSVADKLEEQIKTSLQQAEALRQSILKKAFSGELVR